MISVYLYFVIMLSCKNSLVMPTES